MARYRLELSFCTCCDRHYCDICSPGAEICPQCRETRCPECVELFSEYGGICEFCAVKRHDHPGDDPATAQWRLEKKNLWEDMAKAKERKENLKKMEDTRAVTGWGKEAAEEAKRTGRRPGGYKRNREKKEG